MLQHGTIDRITPRPELKETLATLIDLYAGSSLQRSRRRRSRMRPCSKVNWLKREASRHERHDIHIQPPRRQPPPAPESAVVLSPMDRVKLARDPQRPHTLDYIRELFSNFIELHGRSPVRRRSRPAGRARLLPRTHRDGDGPPARHQYPREYRAQLECRARKAIARLSA